MKSEKYFFRSADPIFFQQVIGKLALPYISWVSGTGTRI